MHGKKNKKILKTNITTQSYDNKTCFFYEFTESYN